MTKPNHPFTLGTKYRGQNVVELDAADGSRTYKIDSTSVEMVYRDPDDNNCMWLEIIEDSTTYKRLKTPALLDPETGKMMIRIRTDNPYDIINKFRPDIMGTLAKHMNAGISYEQALKLTRHHMLTN